MKPSHIISPIRLLKIIVPFILTCSLLFGCSSLSHYKISPEYTKSKYKRVGILVCRMGNKHEGVLAPITIKTDYANRIYKREMSGGSLYMKDHQDIYIDNSERLSKGFPNYPVFRCNTLPDTSKTCRKFYKNITPQIQNTVEQVLKDKGYGTVDIRNLTMKWKPHFSEMSIQNILDKIRNDVDALLILHYFDVEHNGVFSDLWYRIAMFDSKSNEKVIDFQSFYFNGIVNTLYSDKEIPPGKIVVTGKNKQTKESGVVGGGGKMITTTTNTRLQLNLSEKEIIDYVMKYLRYGFKSHNSSDKGLEEIIP